MPNTKKAKKMSYGPGCGFDDYPAGLESVTSGLGSLASEALDDSTESFLAIKSGSLLVGASLLPVCQKVVVPTGEALDGSTGTFSAIKSGSLSMGVFPLASPVYILVSSDQPALAWQVELRQEDATADGMGGLSVLANVFSFPPKGADPGLCTVLVVGPGLCMVNGPDSFDFPPVDVNTTFGGPVLDSKGFEFSSLGAAELGERIRLSLLVMSESGTPIYPSESESVLRHHQKSKANTS
jgi:hypothetical protein